VGRLLRTFPLHHDLVAAHNRKQEWNPVLSTPMFQVQRVAQVLRILRSHA
jgi:hypothetical protein